MNKSNQTMFGSPHGHQIADTTGATRVTLWVLLSTTRALHPPPPSRPLDCYMVANFGFEFITVTVGILLSYLTTE